jgi:hypothetical protein
MSSVRELVIQQLSYACVDNVELDQLYHRVESRLVLNLSSVELTAEQLQLLKLGIGFRPTGTRSLRDDELVESVNAIIGRMASALLTTTEEQTITRLPVARCWRPPSSSSAFEPNHKRELYACAYRTSHKLGYDAQQYRSGKLPNIDVVCGHHLNQLRKRLLVEFRNADCDSKCNMDRRHSIALTQLKRLVTERSVVIRKADKSRQICVMDAAKYDHAVMTQLSDTNSYSRIPFNLNNKCAALIKQCIHKFVARGLLTDKLASILLLYTERPATRRFYGLPKTHKPTSKWTDGMPPHRPICPDIRTETAATGCFIAQYLNPVLGSIKSYFKNSYVLKDRLLNTCRLGSDAVLLTADVESLYPSIPIGEAHHRVVRKLNNKAPEFQLIVELLRIQLKHNYFVFGDKAFQQIKGLPMGKAWAPTVASIYMEEWERSLWQALQFEPVIYVRYIDDIFAVFEGPEDAERFVSAATHHDADIKLSEINIGRSVHFLDLQISLNDSGRFETSLYRKESDLVVLLHRQSSHSASIKDGVILSQLRRFLRLHTDYTEAGLCMRTFMKLMVRLRGLPDRRARFLWSKFVNSIRNGSVPIGRASGADRNGGPKQRTGRLPPNCHLVRLPVPPGVRWKRIRVLLNLLRDQLCVPQSQIMNCIQLYEIPALPIGLALFRH